MRVSLGGRPCRQVLSGRRSIILELNNGMLCEALGQNDRGYPILIFLRNYYMPLLMFC